MPVVPPGRGLESVINKGSTTEIANCLDAVAAAESVIWAVKLKLPGAVGVPWTTPAAVKPRPVGKAPALTVHEYGDIPPVP
jgi:hypothetical protein